MTRQKKTNKIKNRKINTESKYILKIHKCKQKEVQSMRKYNKNGRLKYKGKKRCTPPPTSQKNGKELHYKNHKIIFELFNFSSFIFTYAKYVNQQINKGNIKYDSFIWKKGVSEKSFHCIQWKKFQINAEIREIAMQSTVFSI